MMQREKAELLLRLQQHDSSLLLPNAWDVVSARLFEVAGFSAIGTTSAGIAFAQGYTDGQRISRDEMLSIVARIAAAVEVPVPELFKLGVTRVSIGSAAMQATMGLVRDSARELREQGTYEQMAQYAYDFTEAWKLFQKR